MTQLDKLDCLNTTEILQNDSMNRQAEHKPGNWMSVLDCVKFL